MYVTTYMYTYMCVYTHTHIDIYSMCFMYNKYSLPQNILKEINPWCSLEGLRLKLKLQYFGHLMRRADPLEKTLMLGKIEGRRRRGQQRRRWLDGITDLMDMSLSSGSWWWTGKPGVLQSMGLQRVRHDWATELKLNWTEQQQKVHSSQAHMEN